MMMTKRDMIGGVGVTLAAPLALRSDAQADTNATAREVGLTYI